MSYIKWCSCNRRILTTRQQEENKPCDLCQQEVEDEKAETEREKRRKDAVQNRG